MTSESTERSVTEVALQSRTSRIAGICLAGLGVASALTGHSLAAAQLKPYSPKIVRAIDNRPPPASTPMVATPSRWAAELSLDPIAITEEAGIQSLDIAVSAPRYDSPDHPIERYAISWYVRNAFAEVVIPDLPRVEALSPDAENLQEEVSVPLDLAPGYYALEVLVATISDNMGGGWSTMSILPFRLWGNEVLLVPPEEWVWETLNPRDATADVEN
jgi:hypothetical protein